MDEIKKTDQIEPSQEEKKRIRDTKHAIMLRRKEVLEMLRRGLSYTKITDIMSEKYGKTERQIYDDIAKILKDLQEINRINQGTELAKMIEQYDHLYFRAYQGEQWSVCVDILKNKAKILGLEETVVRHIHEQLETIKSMSDSEIMKNVQMILAERAKEVMDKVKQSEEGEEVYENNN